MNSSIESLEPRRLFSAATNADKSLLVAQERTLLSDVSLANQQEGKIRNALHADLSRLRLLHANTPTYNALARDEATGIRLLNKNVRALGITTNQDDYSFVLQSFNFQQHPNNKGIQTAFSSTLARFEQDEYGGQQKVLIASTNASTGTAVTDLNAIAAIDPSDVTLQSDVQFGLTNLSSTATLLSADTADLQADVATLVSDAAGIAFYGNENLVGAGYTIRANPFAGTVLKNLAPNVSNIATNKYASPATYSPAAGDFAGTDQLYVGSNETPAAGQVAGPQVITLDYSSLVQLGHPISSFTLGIATVDFENPTIDVPYTVSINGVVNTALTSVLNSVDGAGQVEQFVSIGIDPAQLLASKVLTISIDSPGNDRSGWAEDFLTVGIKNG